MPIVKKQKDIVLIDREMITDTRLSYEARGIMAYICSFPEGYKITEEQIRENGSGYSDTDSLRELIKYGYIKFTHSDD